MKGVQDSFTQFARLAAAAGSDCEDRVMEEQAMGEAVDVESAVYCWRRSGVFWRMQASLGLACPSSAPPVDAAFSSPLFSSPYLRLRGALQMKSRSLRYHPPRLRRIAVF